MPPPSNHCAEQLSINERNQTIRMDTDNRKINDSIDDISKIETLRPNSPTFKRLVAVRVKLEKYLIVASKKTPLSQQTGTQTSNYEQPVQPATVNMPLSATVTSEKRIKSKVKLNSAPLDKITYEKTRTNNGNIKQKCSLEIWLPKADSDDDDGNTTRTASPDPDIIANNPQSSPPLPVKSRQSNTAKLPPTSIITGETKSLDELSTKKHEPKIIPRVYHYEKYLKDQGEERPRSGKSGNTNKTDGNGSIKSIKRQRTRPYLRHLSPTTTHIEDSVQWPTSALPMSSRNLLTNVKQNSAGSDSKGTLNPSNATMINDLMRKYSLIKKNHQELTQPRLQLEKPSQDSKHSAHTSKDQSLLSSPPTDSASYISIDQPSPVATKKLLSDTLLPLSTAEHSNPKLIDRRSSPQKSSQPNIYHQTRIFSLVNQIQHRQVSAAMPPALLPAVIGKKHEELNRSFERSKTLDVVFAISNDDTQKIPSRLPLRPESPQNAPNLLSRTTSGIERLPKRSLLPPSHLLRSERPQPQTSQSLVQLVHYQNIQNTAQRYHLVAPSSSTADVSTNKVLVHLKYSNGANTDRNLLIPE